MNAEFIKKAVDDVFERMVLIRRTIHQHPETALEEVETSQYICKILSELGIEYKTGYAKTGIVGLIKGAKKGKTLAIRADIDALQVSERTALPYASVYDGKMHACGHDMHTAILLGTAMILQKNRDKLCGNIKLIFQPAEENVGGAEKMIQDGALQNPPVDAIIGGHVWPEQATGQLRVKQGVMMASPDRFNIKIYGKGGHVARPEKTINPIIMGCRVTEALHGILNTIDPLEPLVVCVSNFWGGTVSNVVPEMVELKGTVRVINEELRVNNKEKMDALIKGIVEPYGGQYEFKYVFNYPPVVNDPEITRLFEASASELIGAENVKKMEKPSMGGEDFSYFLKKIPGTYIRIGCTRSDSPYAPLHSSFFAPDEECMRTAAGCYVKFAFDFCV